MHCIWTNQPYGHFLLYLFWIIACKDLILNMLLLHPCYTVYAVCILYSYSQCCVDVQLLTVP